MAQERDCCSNHKNRCESLATSQKIILSQFYKGNQRQLETEREAKTKVAVTREQETREQGNKGITNKDQGSRIKDQRNKKQGVKDEVTTSDHRSTTTTKISRYNYFSL